jgi:ABC-type sugar transport system substrate-binding protein
LFISVAALAASACTSASTTAPASGGAPAAGGATKTLNIAGVAGNAQDPYWISVMCGASNEAKAEGVNLKWNAANTTSDAEMQTNLNSAMLTKPDGYVIAPFNAATFSTQIGDLMKAGTPVVNVNPVTPQTTYQWVHAANDTSPFAEQVSKAVGTSGSVALMAGSTSATIAMRYKPITDAIVKSSPSVKILEPQITGFDRNKSADLTSSLLIANPDLKMVYTTSGPEGEGAAAAVQQAGLVGKVSVFSFDATPSVVTALKEGTIQGLIAQPAGKTGAEALKSVVGAIKANPAGGAVAPSATPDVALPVQLLTKDNIDKPEVQDYVYKTDCA